MNEEMSIALKGLRDAEERLKHEPPQDARAAAKIANEPGRVIEIMLTKWRGLMEEIAAAPDAQAYARAALELLDQYENLLDRIEGEMGVPIEGVARDVFDGRSFWQSRVRDAGAAEKG